MGVITGECIDLTYEGLGVVKANNFVVFVENLLIGEVADIEIYKTKKKFAFGRVINYRNLSDERIDVECSNYGVCGGCQISHLKHQSEFKVDVVAKNFNRHKIDINVVDCIDESNDYLYRNKIVFPVGLKNGKIVSNPYMLNSHRIIDGQCLFASNISSLHGDVIETLNDNLENKGNLNHLIYRICDDGVALCVVVKKFDVKLERVLEQLNSKFIQISINFADLKNKIMGKTTKVVFENVPTKITSMSKTYQVSPTTFFQINNEVATKMINKLIEVAKFSKDDVVLDAYCGVGSISLAISDYVKYVVGIEINSDSIKYASLNKQLNNSLNAEFICGNVLDKLNDVNKKIDTVIFDPPRAGCDKHFLEQICKLNIPKIIYMSCNSDTQARDVNYLLTQGYKTDKVYVFDMFPHTFHTETLLVLTKDFD